MGACPLCVGTRRDSREVDTALQSDAPCFSQVMAIEQIRNVPRFALFRRFEQEYMGRGRKDVHAYLIDDPIVVRLTGVLTAAEQHLVRSFPAEKGRDLLKELRTHLIEVARSNMEAMVYEITGTRVLSLHHDISTITC